MLETAFFDWFKLFAASPNILLVLVFLAAIIFPYKWALAVALFAGILKDSLAAGEHPAVNTLLFLMWVFLVRKISQKLPLDHNFIRVSLVFLLSLAHTLFAHLLFFLTGSAIAPPGIFSMITILEALYTAAFLPLIYKLIERVLHPLNIE